MENDLREIKEREREQLSLKSFSIINRQIPPINCESVYLIGSNMSLKYRRDVSFSLATFFLRVVGFWLASSRLEEWFANATVMYSIITIIFSMWVQMRGLYFSWGDLSVSPVMIYDFLYFYYIFDGVINNLRRNNE